MDLDDPATEIVDALSRCFHNDQHLNLTLHATFPPKK
tara:strand:- start:245 stop:355 length:111 start_codon:yes stop_codon:yes gene_type:complete